MTTTVPRPLAVSHDGVVACPRHAPAYDAPAWARDGWRALTPDLAADFAAELGAPARCDACLLEARRRRRADLEAEAREVQRANGLCDQCDELVERAGDELCRECRELDP